MADNKRVVVAGATGMIGRELCKELIAKGYQVVVFSRDPQKARRSAPGAAEYIAWKPADIGPWASAIDGAHAVINLAGASLFGQRWTEAYKRAIIDSRVIGTRGLVLAMAEAHNRPQVFIGSSAVGYYGPSGDRKLDESAPAGNDFLAREVCVPWEREDQKAAELGIRTVIYRSGVVINGQGRMSLPIDLRGASLSRPGVVLKTEEGAFPLLVMPFYFFSGGPILPGTQWFAWIHLADTIGLLMLALEDEQVQGPLNGVAPETQTNRDFARAIGRVMGRPAWLPVPGFAMKLLLGEMADMITTGQRVIPKKAEELGYQFKFPTSEQAIWQILRS
ncbi:MAG TPA: TIGR01777 family oxidoreductase [Roseiflexaceae bacterium]|nr:TIGR01777 family oxidoreductase [Roseiflexaceae bacterium]